MTESIKNLTRVCKCENCGNEAEMVVTCSLEDIEQAHQHEKDSAKSGKMQDKKVKGSATCKTCGNEADMWIDL